jgi:hypothetical protein
MTLVDTGRATIDAYLQALQTRGAFADYFTDEVTIDIVGSGQTGQIRGDSGVCGVGFKAEHVE